MVLLASSMVASDGTTSDPKYRPGQVWRYHTRPDEETSRITILKVESREDGNTTVHIRVDGLKLRNPRAPTGHNEVLPHAPIDAVALDRSVVTMDSTVETLPEFEEGYRTWKDSKGGVFTITVAEILTFVEESLNQ